MGLISRGLANFRRNGPVWVGVYSAKLCLAMLFSLPLWVVVDPGLSQSRYADILLREWSLDVIAEYFATHQYVFTSFLVILLVHQMALFLIKQLINGGLYHAYLSPGRAGLATFAAESALRFRGQFRISLMMLPVYVFLALIGSLFAAALPSGLFGPFVHGTIWTGLLRIAVVYLFIILGLCFSELMRLRLAAFPDESLKTAVGPVLNFLVRNVVRLYGIYLLFLVPFLALWGLVEKTALLVTSGLDSGFGVAIELVLFQFCALMHVAQSLLFTATAAVLFAEHMPGRFRAADQGELRFD